MHNMYGVHGIVYMVHMACTNGRYGMHGVWGLCGMHIRRYAWHACMCVCQHVSVHGVCICGICSVHGKCGMRGMYVCRYMICTYTCTHMRIDACLDVCRADSLHVRMSVCPVCVCLSVCLYVCLSVGPYACMYVRAGLETSGTSK